MNKDNSKQNKSYQDSELSTNQKSNKNHNAHMSSFLQIQGTISTLNNLVRKNDDITFQLRKKEKEIIYKNLCLHGNQDTK